MSAPQEPPSPSQVPPPPSQKLTLFDKAAYIAAPGTVVVGLLYYIGTTYTEKYYAELGVPAGDLQLSYQALVARAPGPVFLPLWCLLVGGALVLLVLGRLGHFLALPEHAVRRHRVIRWLLAVGLVMTIVGFPVFQTHLLAPLPGGPWLDFLSPLIIALGATLAFFATQLRLGERRSERVRQGGTGDALWLTGGAVLLGLLAMGLFLQVAQCATVEGRSDAQEDADGGYRQSLKVVVHSRFPLTHNAQDIEFYDWGSTKGPYRFQYSGFRLIAKSLNRFYLVSSTSHFVDRMVVVLPDDDNVWVEFRGV
ncbi:hypothetical protein GCM10010260_16450 [Streptomyces filipinensis]|uniref:Uncharacterized protein n=1 Tax=Streptomyces filipinensis TaxID=66887 RepID=A0A918M917_9ACTN|nr:hypothetical protein [Streptomyces filipinensis]GGU84219.1 hypothetical protein GCM10010260_16450 [Streptomyces filipinensis]